MCYDEMNISIQKLQEIGLSTLSQMLKTLNTHNFLNIYRNILKLGLKMFVLTQGIQLKKNFLQFHLTSSHNYSNDEKLDIFDSDSLHNLPK